MPKVQLQFHGEPHEILELAASWAREHRLALTAEQFFPEYRATVVDDGKASGIDARSPRVDRIALVSGNPDVRAVTAHDFVARNPNALFVSVGPRTDDGLRESAIGGTTEDKELLKVWRSLVRKAKALMHRGATVANPRSRHTAPAPHHLHTAGAHDLAEGGVKMLAAAGWNEYMFDDCSDARASTD